MDIFVIGLCLFLIGVMYSGKKEVKEDIETKKDYILVKLVGIIMLIFGIIDIIKTGEEKLFGIFVFVIWVVLFASFGIVTIVGLMKTK